MIFSKSEALRIESGRKTLLLANVTVDEATGRPKPPARFRVGEDVAVQSARLKDAEPLCRIEILSVTLISLGDLDLAAAKALGFRTQAEMADDWMSRHDHGWPLVEEDLCQRCDGFGELTYDGAPAPDGTDGEECPDCDYGTTFVPVAVQPEDVLERFHLRHGHREMWSVSFVVPTDPLRLLARGTLDADYTTKLTQALEREPEAVDKRTQDRFVVKGREDHKTTRYQSIAAARLADLRRLALQQGVDLHDFLRAEERRKRLAEEREALYLRKHLRDDADKRAA